MSSVGQSQSNRLKTHPLRCSLRKRSAPRFANRRGRFRSLSHISIIIAVLQIKLIFSPTIAVGFRVPLQLLVDSVMTFGTAINGRVVLRQ